MSHFPRSVVEQRLGRGCNQTFRICAGKQKENCSFYPTLGPYFDVAICVAEQREGFLRFAHLVSGCKSICYMIASQGPLHMEMVGGCIGVSSSCCRTAGDAFL